MGQRNLFRDTNRDYVEEGVYRRKRDRHSLYFFQSLVEREVGQGKGQIPVWVATKVSVEPPVFEDVLVTAEESPNYRPAPDAERYVQQMLFSACSKLKDLRRGISDLGEVF